MKHFKFLFLALFAVNVISLIARSDGRPFFNHDQNVITDSVGEDSLNRIYFYLEAAVIMPKSKTVVEKVAEFLRDHPGYKVNVHGHTNGANPGMMTIKGRADDYFHLNDVKNITKFGSAKKLSKERAEIVKEYLTDQGVAKNRIKVFGWGGSRMIYEDEGVDQWRNARVEIELLEK